MGLLIDLIAAAASTLYEQIRKGISNATINNVAQYVNILAAWVQTLVNAFAWVNAQENGAVQYSAAAAKQIGHDLEQIQGSQQAVWNRLIDTILPNTFRNAYRVTQQWAIDYFSPPITQLEDDMGQVLRRVSALETWVANYGTPNIQSLLQFRDDFFKGDQPAINVLNDWLSHPGVFGDWAAAPITGPVIAYLADPKHKTSRDNLTAIIGGAWSEEAAAVWEDLETWLAADT